MRHPHSVGCVDSLLSPLLLFVLCGCTLVFDDIFPLYAMNTPENHGLNFDTDQIGIFIAFGGVVLITYQLLGYPPMAKIFGPLKLLRIAMICYVPLFLLFPHVRYVIAYAFVSTVWC
jgi:hypothetical protein